MTRLTSFVKAYDVRGLVGIQLTSDASRALGYSFARFVAGEPAAVVIAYDMRESSPELAGAFAEGVTSGGPRRRDGRAWGPRTCCTSPPAG